MPPPDPVLSIAERAFLATARRAVLATVGSNGSPRLVPICFTLDGSAPLVWTPLDDKPKRSADPRDLARVRDILARPDVSLLVDRWDEDWSQLAWLRCHGHAELVEPGDDGHAAAVRALRAKYPPYADHALDTRPLIRIAIARTTSWGAVDPFRR